jgi:hypothetical protein
MYSIRWPKTVLQGRLAVCLIVVPTIFTINDSQARATECCVNQARHYIHHASLCKRQPTIIHEEYTGLGGYTEHIQMWAACAIYRAPQACMSLQANCAWTMH